MKAYINKFLYIAAIVTLLIGLTPSIAYAADSGATGSFACTNAAPTITSITLQQSDKSTEADSMTPQTAYVVQIIAGDANTLADISQIDIWIFRDDNGGVDGAPGGTWDADHEAIYRWVSGPTWSMQNGGATTTWSVTTESCETPADLGATSGEWNLYFTVGKLAQEANGTDAVWDIKVTITDAHEGTDSDTIYGKSMGAYSALSLSSATIAFGDIAVGGTAAIQTPMEQYVTLVAISNDIFALGAKSSETWENVGGSSATLDADGTPAAGYFSLTQDNAGDGSGHPTTPQYVTTETANITDLGAVGRTATDAEANEGTTDTDMYMDCILGASGFVVGTYSGTITYTITNS